MKRDKIKKMLNDAKIKLGIVDNIRLELRPMKTKAASISIDKGIIRINKSILPSLDENSVNYLILHELLHYKRKSIYHSNGFYEEIDNYMPSDKIKEAENIIIKSLIKLNGVEKPRNVRKGLDENKI